MRTTMLKTVSLYKIRIFSLICEFSRLYAIFWCIIFYIFSTLLYCKMHYNGLYLRWTQCNPWRYPNCNYIHKRMRIFITSSYAAFVYLFVSLYRKTWMFYVLSKKVKLRFDTSCARYTSEVNTYSCNFISTRWHEECFTHGYDFERSRYTLPGGLSEYSQFFVDFARDLEDSAARTCSDLAWK